MFGVLWILLFTTIAIGACTPLNVAQFGVMSAALSAAGEVAAIPKHAYNIKKNADAERQIKEYYKNVNPTLNYNQIAEGKSTKQDVSTLIGNPTHVTNTPSGEVWAYGCYKTETEFYPITVNFNQEGLVTFKSLGTFDVTGRTGSPGNPMRSSITHTPGPQVYQPPAKKRHSPTKTQLLQMDYGKPLTMDYRKAVAAYFDEKGLNEGADSLTFRSPSPGWIKEQPWEGNGKEAAGYIVFANLNGKDYLCLFRDNRLVKVLAPKDKPWIKLRPE